MMNPLEVSRTFAAGKALSYRQTYQIQGGVRPWTKVRPGIILIDVTKICRELLPGLPKGARVASAHLSYRESIKHPWRQASDMIDAWDDILALGYTHLAISGPLNSLASKRLTEVARFQNAMPFVAFNTLIYKSMTSLLMMASRNGGSRRNTHLKALRKNARQGFVTYVVFALTK